MKIMGIDPGTQRVGYGVVEVTPRGMRLIDSGTIQSRKKSVHHRLEEIFLALTRVADRTRPHGIALEKAFFSRNAASALRMGEGRGVALLCAARAKAELVEYSPNEIKSAVTGSGHASKGQVQYMVKAILGLKTAPASTDTADALAVAICHAYRLERRGYDLNEK